MYKINDKVLLKNGLIAKIVNKNEFREPCMKYAVDIGGFDDVCFIGDGDIARKMEDLKMIKVTEKYYIHAEPKTYVLKERSTIQDEKSDNFGKERFKEVGFYPTIESLLEGVLKFTTREFISKSENKDLKDLKNEIARQTEYLKSLKLDV